MFSEKLVLTCEFLMLTFKCKAYLSRCIHVYVCIKSLPQFQHHHSWPRRNNFHLCRFCNTGHWRHICSNFCKRFCRTSHYQTLNSHLRPELILKCKRLKIFLMLKLSLADSATAFLHLTGSFYSSSQDYCISLDFNIKSKLESASCDV